MGALTMGLCLFFGLLPVILGSEVSESLAPSEVPATNVPAETPEFSATPESTPERVTASMAASATAISRVILLPTDNPSGTLVSSPTDNPSRTIVSSPTNAPVLTPGAVTAANQLTNPYFEGSVDADIPDWEDNGRWHSSDKAHNPSPDHWAANTRGPEAGGGGAGIPGQDSVLSQVVDSRGTSLAAEIACVQINGTKMDVNIYGGDSLAGPWELLWVPFNVSICPRLKWGGTQRAEFIEPDSWAFYKFEIRAQFSSPDGATKVTNAFFISE